MSSRSMRGTLLATVFTLGLGATGHAANVTEAQANDLAARLRAWAAGLTASQVPLPPELFAVAPAGEDYKITFRPPAGTMRMTNAANQPTDALVTYFVRPLDGTRWRIGSIETPAAATLTPEGAAAIQGVLGNGLTPELEVSFRARSASGVYDTALASESSLEYRTEGVAYTVRDLFRPGATAVTANLMTGTQKISAAVGGAVDYRVDGAVEGYASAGETPAGPTRFAARRMLVQGEIKGVMVDQLSGLIRHVAALAARGPGRGGPGADGPDAKPRSDGKDLNEAKEADDAPAPAPVDTKAQREEARKVLALVRGLLRGLSVRQSLEGVEIEVAGQKVALDRLRMAFGGEAPADKFGGFMEIGAEGVKASGLPPPFADLAPRVVSLRPTVANIDLSALTALAQDALADGADPSEMQARLAALMTKGTVRLGIENLILDIGIARLTGSGNGTFVSPVSGRAEGQVAVTGFDALMQRAQTLPNAEQVLPALALVKGLGKADGDRLVWNLQFGTDNRLMVNGMDVSKMGGKKR